MLMVIKRKTVILGTLAILTVIGGIAVLNSGLLGTAAGDFDYRVFVAGIGTIEGKWSGETGIAVVGLETRPDTEQGRELKVVDLLIANSGSAKTEFRSDVFLINRKGEKYGLKAEGQPKVVINPGALSQGTVVISVPKGIPDNDWLLQISGGNLPENVLLPLRVIKATGQGKKEQ